MTVLDENARKARLIQLALACVFLLLGGWCLVAPHMVERLVFRPEYQHLDPTSGLLMACFGAQAVLVGLVIAFSRFTARTFLVFGISASLPFFVFNYYFYYIAEIFTPWMLLDFAGNAIILTCGICGWLLLKSSKP